MSATGLDVFDKTLQTTNIWLNEIMEDEDVGADRQRAYHALRAVLHALRDRLTVEEAAHLGAQLPLLVRGIYFDGWHPAHKPQKIRDEDEFLARIGEELTQIGPLGPRDAAEAVFRVLDRHVSAGEIQDVKGMLPRDFADLFPTQGEA